jgi:recombination protein RecA
MGDSHVGLQARLMSQALRKLTGNVKHANCLLIFINQIRMKIGVMFGSPKYVFPKMYESANDSDTVLSAAV